MHKENENIFVDPVEKVGSDGKVWNILAQSLLLTVLCNLIYLETVAVIYNHHAEYWVKFALNETNMKSDATLTSDLSI